MATAGREVGRWYMVPNDCKGGGCLVLGDFITWNVGTECSDMNIECFPGNGTEQLDGVTAHRDLGFLDTIIIHVGRNNLRQTGNLNYIVGDVYNLVNMAKTKFSTSWVGLSGVLWRQDVSWRHIGVVNSRYEWVAQTLGVTFVDPNSWVDNWDFGRDGLHITKEELDT